MKYPFERQIDLKDCGVCCLQMLTKYYGGGVSKEYLRELTHTTKDGVSAYSLIEGAKQLGFASYGIKGDFTNLKNNDLPCIAHVVMKKSYQHFIVIYKIDFKKKILIIADPAKKKISSVSFHIFEKISTKNFILLNPVKQIKFINKNSYFHSLLCSFTYKYKKQVLIILAVSFLITMFSILSSFQFKMLTDYVISYQNTNNLFLISIIFFSIILLKEICSYYRNSVMNTMNHCLDRFLTLDVYHHILSLPYLYYKNRTTGEIIARMNDINNIREVITKILVAVFLDFPLAILIFITLLILNMKLSLIMFIMTLILILLIIVFQKPIEDYIQKGKEKSASLNSFLVETIGGIETIKNQNIQSFIENNFLLKYCTYNRTSHHINRLFILEQFFKDLFSNIGTFFIIVVGSYLVVKGELDLALLITFTTLSSYLLEPVKNIMDLTLTWKDAKISFKRIKELYEVEVENSIVTNKRNLDLLGNIVINHLEYSYNGKDLLLKDINMKIDSKDKVLIHGSSGSGKSTLAKILAKQLLIKNKMIFLDDKEFNLYQKDNIIKKVCYISQQETLFTDTIYQNIVLNQNIEYNHFLEISKLCMIDEFVENNFLAYDTLLEENGFNLSGGQRQRIILARALLKDADIYIFDESLNEVDIYKERKILENLFTTYPNKTFIVISHRFHNQDLFTKKYKIEEGISYEEQLEL